MRVALTLEGVPEARQLLEVTASRLEQPPCPLLETLAETLQASIRGHIQHQTGPDGPWPPLAPVTRKIRAYYGHSPEGALVRSGELLQSLTTLSLEDRALEVGTRTSFARTLQDGGTIQDARTGRPRTVQAFPFVFVTVAEVQDLVALVEAFYFEDNHFAR